MDQKAINGAAAQLAEATMTGRQLPALVDDLCPETLAEAHMVQDALVGLLQQDVVGYKVAGTEPDKVMRGAILESRLYRSPARVAASSVPLLGMEAEIAFRFDRDMPPREEAYSAAEISENVTALPVIEIVSSRFTDYSSTPVLHRLCDCMSNGALICGEPRQDWRTFDFSKIRASLSGNGRVMAETVGGHADADPLLPTVALVNALRYGAGIKAGQVVAAGTFTGLVFATAGMTVSAAFDGFGDVEVHLEQ